jgi:hypothetical protein
VADDAGKRVRAVLLDPDLATPYRVRLGITHTGWW